MRQITPSPLLLASDDSVLLESLQPALIASGMSVQIARSLEAAFAAMAHLSPSPLIILDENLPALEPGLRIDAFLAFAHEDFETSSPTIIVLSDSVTEEWRIRLSSGIVDDLVLRSAGLFYILLRLEIAAHNRCRRAISTLRDLPASASQRSKIVECLDRARLLSMLFRETDRAQRMKTPLSLILIGIDPDGENLRPLTGNLREDIYHQVAQRTTRPIRSYDLLRQIAEDEFLLALPGCDISNATTFAERLRANVLAAPFQTRHGDIPLTFCFAITASAGRSPVVVLREAETILDRARKRGPGTIDCNHESTSDPDAAFFSLDSANEQAIRIN